MPEASQGVVRRLGLLALTVLITASVTPAIAGERVPELAAAAVQLLASVPRGDDAPLYVGVQSGDVALLRDLRVQVDGAAPVRYQFSEDEARALGAGGLKRMLGLPPGEHRLRGEFVARAPTAKAGATRYAATFDLKVTASQPYSLRFSSGGALSAARVELQTAGAEAALREADYLLASGRAFDAAVLLETAPDPQRREAAARALGLLAPGAIETPTAVVAYNQALSGGDNGGLATLANSNSATSADALALRDLASVTAGYRELQAGRGDVASEYFKRVRSPGPYSNAAMLGLGWCYLWPSAGTVSDVALRPGDANAIAATRRQTPFRYLQAVASGARADDLRRALIPWAELLGRDPLDPAVQEGMLAIPYALDHFGAHTQALRYYERALATFDDARGTLAASRAQIASGELLTALDARDADNSSGWPRLLVEQRDETEAVPLRVFAADAGVGVPLRDYRLLRSIDRALLAQGEADPRAGALRTRVAAATAETQAQLKAAMFATLQKLEQQTTRYQAEAEFAMARLYDRQPHGVEQ